MSWRPGDLFRSDETIAARDQQIANRTSIDKNQELAINADSHHEMIDAQQKEKNRTWDFKNGEGIGNRAGTNALRYPQELQKQNPDSDELLLPNGVKFYINARQTSVAAETQAMAVEGNTSMQQELIEANQEYAKEYTKENRAKAESYETAAAATGALAAALGTAAGIANGNIIKDSSNLGKTLLTAGTALVGAGVAALVADNTSTLRLLKTISLYVPQSIIAAYSANWNEQDLGIAGMIGSGRMDFADLAEAPEFAGRGAIAAAANVPKAIGADADFGATLEATSKKVSNPYKEQLFKSMGFRKFSFNYTFAPRNSNEAQMVADIIETFKYHMHPESSPGDMFLIYPAEFSIEFTHGEQGLRNKNLPKISSCALTSCKVTYGPDGMFNTFKGTEGYPTEMTMELAFTELETLTAVRIAQGY
jgi:hypothetical protein